MTDEIRKNIKNDLNDIINYYDTEMEKLFSVSLGGTIRGAKGTLVENIAKKLLELTWTKVLKQSLNGFDINHNKQNILIKNYEEYITRKEISEEERKRIKKDPQKIKYNFSADIHVVIDEKLALAIECKSYTEIAMFKRIMIDSMLMDEALPNATYCLFQLESAFSSDQYHVLMSHHTRNIDVITLLDGKRDPNRPIHKKEYFKELKLEALYSSVTYFENKLKAFVRKKASIMDHAR